MLQLRAELQSKIPRLSRAVVFIGFMGAGKSTAAEILARTLGLRVLDSDRLLEERLGHSIAEEFQADGEQAFRVAEEELVCELLDGLQPDCVVSLGGGSVLSQKVREALEPHMCVLLDITQDEAWLRVSDSSKPRPKRPLAEDEEAFRQLHATRQDLYLQIADAILPARPRECLREAIPALAALTHSPAGTRLLWASSRAGDYPVLIGPSLLGSPVWPTAASRRFCVTDQTVGEIYGPRLGEVVKRITIAPGESSKTLQSAQRIWEELALAGMTRSDELVALGGGVVGDLAGFCAATYQRGVPVVQVPTTLLAQVDSAYGGKTGIDLPQAKNYVGAYHQPACVIVDTQTLNTLPANEVASGYAEVLKTALIAGGEFWQVVAADEPLDEQIIFACARTKLTVVSEDERDEDTRQVLNLGYTVAHAIEALTGYERLRHGEAVALGLLAALRLSGQQELREEVSHLLSAHSLPVNIQDVDADEVIALCARDKKRTGERVPFVLVSEPGDVRTGCDVSDRDLRLAVRELIS